MDWFPWYPALYRADTLDLTLEQDGAYRRLIDHYMETRLPLPDNNNSLSRIIGISVNDFQAIAEQLRCKFTAKDGSLHNKRCDIELNRQDSLSKKRSSVAKSAYEKRNENNNVGAIAKQKPSNCINTGQDKTGEDSKEVSNQERASLEGEADKKSSSKSNGSRLPENWAPTNEEKSYASGLGLDPESTAEDFKDHWLSKAGAGARKADWGRTWKTWCRRAVEFKARKTQTKGGNGFIELIRSGKV